MLVTWIHGTVDGVLGFPKLAAHRFDESKRCSLSVVEIATARHESYLGVPKYV